MNILKQNLYKLDELRNIVKTKNKNYMKHSVIENCKIVDSTISIVMTSHNRSKQVYFTLKTISQSFFKNVHIILVDDSDSDKVDIDILKTFQFYIDFIEIDKDQKCWHNPCVNYNIGFEFIKGSKVIIQNSEVCHIGDVLIFIDNNLKQNEYLVFDVKTSRGFQENEIIYNMDTDISIFEKDLFSMWYQHHIHINRQFHFMSALCTDLLKKIDGFSFDYAYGASYDDNDLLLKIQSTGALVKSIDNTSHNIGGIHLYHASAPETWDKAEINERLFSLKKRFVELNGYYLEISNKNDKENAYQKLFS
jgi:glycosyltransferase involved in cell wall biosynthesis